MNDGQLLVEDAAAAIERLLSPMSGLIGGREKTLQERADDEAFAREVLARLAAVLEEGAGHE